MDRTQLAGVVMSLFGSIGIGPVRIGASTSGRRSSSGSVNPTQVGLFLVIMTIFVICKYAYIAVPLLIFAGILGAIGWIVYISEQDKAETARKRAEITDRMEEQHAQLMDGDERGLYGQYPPAEDLWN